MCAQKATQGGCGAAIFKTEWRSQGASETVSGDLTDVGGHWAGASEVQLIWAVIRQCSILQLSPGSGISVLSPPAP